MSKFNDIYEKQGLLGKGAFSKVYKCLEKETGKEFAAKIIKTAAMSVRELIKLEREARINRKVEHQNIVQLHNTIQVSLIKDYAFLLLTPHFPHLMVIY